ncbi:MULTISPECIES: GNAT family N-acetyltransferase [Lysinibacillus]|uniref:GNAT family N-acetyltransferase n=1 Tax=Lysinibacillus TaxID=400634 RepID=UPI00088A277D|nr:MULTISPECIES: GNAT family N-acetyltransferase [unclassified Lysinibacillus]MEE3806704.1 GNAT family N-acetyltransferase [Lysinibacillus fusiformis]WCH49727.1 GNAT family N-acetyltransferase [Lysinibacillus sp. OF-1]SCY06062.1 Acetyltransferase (GNAT) family protein [Lysinibacillus sp. SG9]SDB14005.1 Acetyltransferase (GNAT) family protein [Lysinibacillus sp. TC-37]SFS52848.1 Acetyltransferase (GNAT) family protein [Lysinibacillus sp. SG55]
MTIMAIHQVPKQEVNQFFQEHWGSTEMVISSGIYNCSELDGFVFVNEQQAMIGLITYIIRERDCEIISLDSTVEGKGIGTALVKAVEQTAVEQNCAIISLITTNDNLHALKFYQKRGYCLIEILRNAVEKARVYKPSIPLLGDDGIPIRDEIRLQKQLDFQ